MSRSGDEGHDEACAVAFVRQLRAIIKDIAGGKRYIELADYRKRGNVVLLDGEGANYRVTHKRQRWKAAKPDQLRDASAFRIGGNDGGKLSLKVDRGGGMAEVHYEELFGADKVGLNAHIALDEAGVAKTREVVTAVHRTLRDKERELRQMFQDFAGEVYSEVGAQRLIIRRELYDDRLGRETKRAVLYRPTKVLFGPVLKSMFSIDAYGRDHIPRRGAAIIAANHISFSDCLFIPACVDRRVTFVAKKELFEGQLQGMLFSNWGQIPIDRGAGDTDALRTALNVLKSGHLLGIFPEGTRSTVGEMLPAHTGVARLALMARVPVIPCGLLGGDEILPKGAHIPRVKPAVVSFGEPLLFSDHYGDQNDYHALKTVTTGIIDAIAHQIEEAKWGRRQQQSDASWTSITLPSVDDDLMLG